MNNKYSTLLFDLDDTLLDFGKAEDNAVNRLFTDYGIPLTEENKRMYVNFNISLWKALEREEITREELFRKRFTEFFAMVGVDADGQKANSEFISYIAQGSFIIDGALEVCERLSESYRMYIITNGSKKAQQGRLSGSPLMKYFDGVFISEEIGAVKPKKEFFDYVFSHIGEKDRSRVLVIGDSLTSDIAGAVSYGLDSCWVNSRNSDALSPATYTVKSLSELYGIL